MTRSALLLLLFFFPTGLPAQPLPWRKDYDLALAEARERRAPLFILFAGLPCAPAERMYRRVLAGEEIRKAAADFVPLLCHLQESQEAYFKGWPAYLRQLFFTPSYVFADPAGRNLMPRFTVDTMHRMLSREKVIELLGKVRSRCGEVIPRPVWLAERERLARARDLLERGKEKEGLDLLAAIAGSGPVPRLAGKARLELDRRRALADFAREREALLAAEGDLSPAQETRLRALDQARNGDLVAAREILSGFRKKTDGGMDDAATGLETRLAALLRRGIEAGRVKVTRICPDFPYGAYWQIGLTLGIELPRVRRVTLQYQVLTEEDKFFTGYRTFDVLEREERLQPAAYVPLHLLAHRLPGKGGIRVEKIARVRFQVFAGSLPVAAGSLPPGRAEEDLGKGRLPRPITFLEDMDWSWEKDFFHLPVAEGLVFGRDLPWDPTPPPPDDLAAAVMVHNLDTEIVVPSRRGEVKALLELGRPAAAEAILAAYDPERRAATTFLLLLARLREPRALPLIAPFLKHENHRYRSYGLRLLDPYLGTGHVPPELVAPLLADEEPELQQRAARLMGHLDRAEALPLLRRALDGEELFPEVRQEIGRAITRLAVRDFGLAKEEEGDLDRARQDFDRWFGKHQGVDTRHLALAGLRHAGYKWEDPGASPPAELLARAARDKQWYVAAAALRLLARRPDPKLQPLLLEIWRDENKDALHREARLALFAAATPALLVRLCRLGLAEEKLARPALEMLKELAGNHTFLERGRPRHALEQWEEWLEENQARLERPPGARRFRPAPPRRRRSL